MGFPRDLFVDAVDDSLLCLICKKVPQNLRQCPECEGCFCDLCIAHHLEKGAECPNSECDASLSADTVKSSQWVRSLLNKLRMKCPFSREGCEETPKLGEYKEHAEACDFSVEKPVECGQCGLEEPQIQLAQLN
jgi:hypothetical protein